MPEYSFKEYGTDQVAVIVQFPNGSVGEVIVSGENNELSVAVDTPTGLRTVVNVDDEDVFETDADFDEDEDEPSKNVFECSYCAHYAVRRNGTASGVARTVGTRAAIVAHAEEHPIGDPEDMVIPRDDESAPEGAPVNVVAVFEDGENDGPGWDQNEYDADRDESRAARHAETGRACPECGVNLPDDDNAVNVHYDEAHAG